MIWKVLIADTVFENQIETSFDLTGSDLSLPLILDTVEL